MGAVFGRAMDGESENGRSTRQVKLALIGEAPFLLVTFLWALAKKSDPPTAEALKAAAGMPPSAHRDKLPTAHRHAQSPHCRLRHA
jgi:hypothetical protein